MALVLVINCGSSSIKFALLEPSHGPEHPALLFGVAEKLFEAEPRLSFTLAGQQQSQAIAAGHTAALHAILAVLTRERLLGRVTAVGHRVVHGGERFVQAVRIASDVLEDIRACVPLAPLHNPANLTGIEAALQALPALPQVAVFDTAFHQTMPERAYRYPIPEALYREHGVRRYGFHGSSHAFVAMQAARVLGQPLEQLGLVSAHLGNGCSLAAIQAGKSLDTSMGLTPLEGLVMGTRSGDVDPGLHGFLGSLSLGWTLQDITQMLNQQSGLLGLSGLSNDCRELQDAMRAGHAGAKLALEVFCYRLAKGIAAISVALESFDALIFTGGIGENSAFVRATTLAHLRGLGFVLDEATNQNPSGHTITQANSRTALVVKTNEEWMIAEQTLRLASAQT